MNPTPIDPTSGLQSGGARVRLWRRRWQLAIGTLMIATLAALGLSGMLGSWKKELPPTADPMPLPPVAVSPFRNAGADVRFVGSEACRACHVDADASFRRSGMGRSMAGVDPGREPPDAVFDHALSQRRYQVVRKDGRLWHRELLLAGQREEVVLSEYPLQYVVGSGRHSRTYLVEAEGFLVESPLTWYASKRAWGMSPGFDEPQQPGFARAADEGCLICHAGQAEATGGSAHRMHVAEAAIGCERCHGPGALHVERYAGPENGRVAGVERSETPERRARAAKTQPRPPVATGIDYTIVTPARLPRELAEAVCQQCHLRSSATVVARGRKPTDFRPGLPLQDFRYDYRLDVPNSPMTVVGHVEQMHLSRCYKASGTLTCLTCHNPHGEPEPAERVDYYRAICLDCHAPARCSVNPRRRQQESPENDCVHCHMPRSATEIPHLAMTHHRIGMHGPVPAGERPARRMPSVVGELRPVLDLSRLPELDRQRSLGLGYLEVANLQRDARLAATYRQRAFESLCAVQAQGLRDALVDVSLARLRFDLQLGDVRPLAESALAQGGLTGPDRCTALLLLADAHAHEGRPAEAVTALRQLVQLRRHSGDWLLLADCERMQGHEKAAAEAWATAIRLNPRLGTAQRDHGDRR